MIKTRFTISEKVKNAPPTQSQTGSAVGQTDDSIQSYARELAAAGKSFKAVGTIESGLRVKVVDELAATLDLPSLTIRALARISPSTFVRRQKAGRLSPEESDRVYRLQSAVKRTTDFFEGDTRAARRWLTTPAPALGGVRPMAMLGNEAGVREVEALLDRLEHGVFT